MVSLVVWRLYNKLMIYKKSIIAGPDPFEDKTDKQRMECLIYLLTFVQNLEYIATSYSSLSSFFWYIKITREHMTVRMHTESGVILFLARML